MPRPHTLLLPALFAFVCFAQDRGNVTGSVTDPAGAAVPGASVRILNPANGFEQTTSTGSDGNYNVPSLPVGKYNVSAEKPGFRTAQQTGVNVDVANTVRVDLKLEVGQVTERVEVSGAAPVVVTERSDLGTVIDSKTIL